MSYWWRDNWTIVAIVAVAVLLIAPMLVHGFVAGYPDASVDIFLHRYCVKRVDQTDVVVPLSDVQR